MGMYGLDSLNKEDRLTKERRDRSVVGMYTYKEQKIETVYCRLIATISAIVN